jgi:hypothetical protein
MPGKGSLAFILTIATHVYLAWSHPGKYNKLAGFSDGLWRSFVSWISTLVGDESWLMTILMLVDLVLKGGFIIRFGLIWMAWMIVFSLGKYRPKVTLVAAAVVAAYIWLAR